MEIKINKGKGKQIKKWYQEDRKREKKSKKSKGNLQESKRKGEKEKKSIKKK